MRKIKEVIICSLLMICMCFTLSGCTNNTETTKAVAIVLGARSNNFTLPVNANSLDELLNEVALAHGRVSAVTVESNPQFCIDATLQESTVKGISEGTKKRLAQQATAKIKEQLLAARPLSSEADTFASVVQGARALRSGGADIEYLFVYDSGLSTCGYLDFRRGLLRAKPEDIVQALQEIEAIPDLTGIDVIWVGLGEVALPQKPLALAEKKDLEDIWRAILEAGHAKSITFSEELVTATPYEDLPKVSVIDLSEICLEVNIPIEIPKNESKPFVLDEQTLSFLGDQAVFTNSDQAKQVAKEVASMYADQPNSKILVVGSTASGKEDFCLRLSAQRADAFKELLISQGIDEGRIITIAVGFQGPNHVTDRDANGNLIEERACQNRCIIIMDLDSDEAQQYLAEKH